MPVFFLPDFYRCIVQKNRHGDIGNFRKIKIPLPLPEGGFVMRKQVLLLHDLYDLGCIACFNFYVINAAAQFADVQLNTVGVCIQGRYNAAGYINHLDGFSQCITRVHGEFAGVWVRVYCECTICITYRLYACTRIDCYHNDRRILTLVGIGTAHSIGRGGVR